MFFAWQGPRRKPPSGPGRCQGVSPPARALPWGWEAGLRQRGMERERGQPQQAPLMPSLLPQLSPHTQIFGSLLGVTTAALHAGGADRCAFLHGLLGTTAALAPPLKATKVPA